MKSGPSPRLSVKHKRIYLDGKLSAESSRNDGAIGAAAGYPLEFGHYVASKTQWFHGQLDEVRLEQRALSADQIRMEFERQRKLVGIE